jgi:hypothetical protein
MDYNSEEYLALFNKIKKEPEQQNQMLRETPNYDRLENLNEVQRQPQQPQNFNMNEFKVETRMNGQRINEANPNGLDQFMDDNLNEIRRHSKQDRLNEVMRLKEQERLNAVKQQEHLNELKKQEEAKEREKLNETVNFNDADYVTLEMFNRARYSSMMQVAQRTIPRG